MTETNPKVHATHLARHAVVYLRQSTMRQVHENRESTERQYALARRATDLGWPSESVEVIDEDLGQSGASAEWRTGFKRLAEEISHGRVGAIFALEVSRLARSSADWHRLLDLCGWSDVLIADENGVFTPNDPNDRLLLGLKGQMSEAERYWMRLRLHGARYSKARRGELRLDPPRGYVWDTTGQRLCLDPDEEVQRAIRLVFERFQIDGSAGGVMAYFIAHGLSFPTRRPGGEIARTRLRSGMVISILHNPIYAGAYVYGRREYRTALVEGKLRRGHVTRLPMASWKVCIPDRHAAYITWEEFLANQEKIDSNRNVRHDGGVRGAAREGEALLQGLVLCGRCGYRLTVQQGGKAAARYLCTAPQMHGVSTKVCWSVSASRVDAIVARVFLQAVQPPEIELSLAVTREVERQAGDLERQWKARLERARYEAQLAERRYKAVDPDNRVVARTLESDWEAKLRDVEDLENASERARRTERLELTDADRGEITRMARDLPRVWNANTTTNVQRKRLVRLLVQQVTLTPIDVPRRMTRVQILWHTGAVTDVSTERPRYLAGRVAADEIVEEIRRRVAEGWSDTAIAADFNRRGVVSSMGRAWNKQTVRGLRKRREICSKNAPPEDGRWPTRRADGMISLRGVAERYGVPRGTARFWIAKGLLVPVEGGGHGRPLWFVLDANTERRLADVSKAVRRYQSAHAGGEV